MKQSTYGGISFFDALLLINIVLKLTGFIKWSWWVVLWPLWISIFIIIIIMIIIFIIMTHKGE